MCSRIKGLPRKLKWNSIISTGSVHSDSGGGDGISAELFQILKDDAVKVLQQYANKFGKLSSGHKTGKGQFLFQSKEGQCQRMFKLLHN